MIKYLPAGAALICGMLCVEGAGFTLFVTAVILGIAAIIILILGGDGNGG